MRRHLAGGPSSPRASSAHAETSLGVLQVLEERSLQVCSEHGGQ